VEVEQVIRRILVQQSLLAGLHLNPLSGRPQRFGKELPKELWTLFTAHDGELEAILGGMQMEPETVTQP
jgi:hypothetical protein